MIETTRSRRRWALSLAALVVVSGAAATHIAWAQTPAQQEPPAQYVLEIDGKLVSIRLNQSTSVKIGSKAVRVRLSRQATRTFDKAGVRFSYPVDFAFQADTSDPDLTIWKMTGSDSMAMLQQYDPVDAASVLNLIVSGITNEYGRQKVRASPASIKTRRGEIKGRKLVLEDEIVQEIFAFRSSRATFVLILQDNQTFDNRPTAEAAKLKKMIASTLTYR